MMYTPAQTLTFTMPISLQAHQVAQQFWRLHPNQQKAKQVYLNTIAVQTVQTYLQWFGIATDLESGDSWNPALQALADTADLVIKDQGKLECRPVLPNQEVCLVPAEVWQERIGYVAVQLNAELTEATLLGFLPQAGQLEVPLQSLQSLDRLLEVCNETAPSIANLSQVAVHLSQWLQNTIDTGWQTLDALFPSSQLAFVMRGSSSEASASETNASEAGASETGAIAYISRGKRLNLGSATHPVEVVLLVEFLPLESNPWEITVKLCPQQEQSVLPTDVEVMILDEQGVSVMQAQSRSTEMIQLKFLGSPGERFGVKVMSEFNSVTEEFCV
ncbi:MAG: hypothetical protein B0A82_08305 [Alkalinema sp. CACIAM 70d]|nr:MAG: hypothetical protein B0A82_08305 [Alkalinema sp. CACIAM 70d]